MKKRIIDPLAYHEVLDRTVLIADLVDRQLLAHPVVLKSPKMKVLAESALESLSQLSRNPILWGEPEP
jgi:hypothetical protein